MSSPSAENVPGLGGTIVLTMPISAARRLTWTGPAPPNPTSPKPRGSSPRWTDISRSALAIAALAISTIPKAAVTTSRPERVGAALADRPRRGVHVEMQLAAEERLGAEPAEDEVGVGDGRLRGRRGRRRPVRAPRRR